MTAERKWSSAGQAGWKRQKVVNMGDVHGDNGSQDVNYIAIGISLGIAFGVGIGVALGAAMGNLGIGVALGSGIGLAFGIAFGAAMSNKQKTSGASDE